MLQLISNLMTNLSNILIWHEVAGFDRLAESICIDLFGKAILHHKFLSKKSSCPKQIGYQMEKIGMF